MDMFYLYDSEKKRLDELMKEHKKHESDSVAPYRFSVSFYEYSVTTIPVFTCNCGYEENLATDERYDNI